MKIKSLYLLVVLVLVSLFGCLSKNEDVIEVDFGSTDLTKLRVGDEINFEVSLNKSILNNNYEISFSNTNLVLVDNEIKVVNFGPCTITISHPLLSIHKEYETEVIEPGIYLSILIAPGTSAEIGIGQDLGIYALFHNGVNASVVYDLIWTSSNEEVATVDENGTVIGVSYGTTIIRAEHKTHPEYYHFLTITVE